MMVSLESAIIAGDLAQLETRSTAFAMMRAIAGYAPGVPVFDFPAAQGLDTPPAVSALREAGVIVEAVGPPGIRAADSPHGKVAAVAHRVLEGLKRRRVGTLHVVGDLSSVHYVLQARRLGLFEMPAKIVAHVSTPLLYRLETGRQRAENYADIARIYMERRVIEQAEQVVAGSATIADWLARRGWRKDAEVAPGLADKPSPARRDPGAPSALKCLLFAGTLTDGKALTNFIYAAERLERQGRVLGEIVLSGATDPAFPADAFLEDAANRLGAPIRRLAPHDRPAFLDLARRPGTLTVIPSRFDDRPAALLELVAIDAPVIASDVGDARDILHPDDAKQILVPPHPSDLATRIAERMDAGLTTEYRSLRETELKANAQRWETVLIQQGGHAPTAAKPAEQPLVSVCVAHFNRPDSVLQMLHAMAEQTYRNIEILIVDDGSEAEHLARLEELVAQHGYGRVIRQENLYLGAARNTGARHARGKYLLFKDDDNISKPHEIETFVTVAEHNGSDILTCFSDNFEGDALPSRDNLTGVRRLPFGPDPIYAMFRNGFGDSNCFVRRSVWEALGGFTEHYRIGLDDHEFFARAMLNGYDVALVPDALYYYRLGGEKMKRFHVADLANEQRILAPLIERGQLPPEWLPVVMLARQFNG